MLRFGLACSWGTKSKIGICVYISLENKYSQQLHVTLSTESFSQATSKPFQCFCWETLVSNSASASVQVTTSPHPSSLQTLRSVYGKGHPNSQNICFHKIEYSSEKYSPWSPLCLMVVSLSRLPLSEAFCPTAPMEALPAPELHLTAQNQPLCTSVGLQDMLAASAFPLLHLEIYSNLSEVVRGT